MDGYRVVIDRVACDGAGVCAHLAPSVISLDQWGYPFVGTVTEVEQVRRAVKGCPRRAVHLIEIAPVETVEDLSDQSSSSSL